MGEVEVALRREERSEQLFAIKRPHQKFLGDPSYLRMFEREGRIAQLIEHPNVVSVVEVGTDDRGPYLVMDYIQGLSLSRLRKVVGQLPVQVALRIIRQVAHGLQAAHELRDEEGQLLHLVHRDVSPQNILVGFDGSVHVTDFGIARAMREQSQTATGVVKGKLAYLAPELLRFEDATERSDLFALGVVMFELLTNERLYHGSRVPWRILHEAPPNVRELRDEVSPEAAHLNLCLLAKQPDGRPKSSRELIYALDSLIAALAAREGAYGLNKFAEDTLTNLREEHARWLAEGLGALRENDDTADLHAFDFAHSGTTVIDAQEPDVGY